jgi:hypothetical protein
LFDGKIVTNSNIVSKEKFSHKYLVDDYGVNQPSKPKLNIKCIKRENNGKPVFDPYVRQCPISISISIDAKIDVVAGGATSINPTYTESYILNHEFGHSDYHWGAFIVALFFIENNFNHLENTNDLVFIPGGQSWFLLKNRDCEDLKLEIENAFKDTWNMVKDNSITHEMWDFYGRSTDKEAEDPKK